MTPVELGGAIAVALALIEALRFAIGKLGRGTEADSARAEAESVRAEAASAREARKVVYEIQQKIAEMTLRDESHQRDLEVGVKALSDVLTRQTTLLESVDRRLEHLERGR